jgi:lipid-A-disaccharide synthase-like uncharacterized protein
LSLLGPNILLSTLFSNTLCLSACLIHDDQVSHLYKAKGKIVIIYDLIFKFLDKKWQTKVSALNDSKHSLTSICS